LIRKLGKNNVQRYTSEIDLKFQQAWGRWAGPDGEPTSEHDRAGLERRRVDPRTRAMYRPGADSLCDQATIDPAFFFFFCELSDRSWTLNLLDLLPSDGK
jgi:hypothetical protein